MTKARQTPKAGFFKITFDKNGDVKGWEFSGDAAKRFQNRLFAGDQVLTVSAPTLKPAPQVPGSAGEGTSGKEESDG